MEKKEPYQRLAAVRAEAGFATASEAARAYGWNENTYRSHENGERGIKKSVAEKYGRAFGVTAAFILIDEKYQMFTGINALPVSGSVGHDGLVSLISKNMRPSETTHYASMSIGFWTSVFAIEVTGYDVLNFLSEEDLIVVNKNRSAQPIWVGRLHFIKDKDENCYLRFLLTDGSGKVNINNSYRSAPIWIEAEEILPVAAIIPRGQWKKEDRADFVQRNLADDDDE